MVRKTWTIFFGVEFELNSDTGDQQLLRLKAEAQKGTVKALEMFRSRRSPECAEERSMITDFLIRLEAASDREGVEELLLAAFPTSLELRLVRQLREDADVVFSLVAVETAGVIGHALFSRLRAPTAALGLGPIAVTAKRRRRGVAAAMIEAGLERAKAEGWAAVVVVGDPSYYPRFGFSQEAVRGMSCPYAGPALMGLALADGGLDGPRIEYASAFSSIPD